jgi:hypothetical protein
MKEGGEKRKDEKEGSKQKEEYGKLGQKQGMER